jgi:hypothetical protein
MQASNEMEKNARWCAPEKRSNANDAANAKMKANQTKSDCKHLIISPH